MSFLDKLNIYHRTIKNLSPYRQKLLCIFIFASLEMAIILSIPYIIKNFVDSVWIKKNIVNIKYVLIIISLLCLKALFHYLYQFNIRKITEEKIFISQNSLFRHLLFLPLKFFRNYKTGEITYRVTRDISSLEFAVTYSLISLTFSILTIIGGVCICFYLNPKLMIYMCVIFLLLLLITFGN